MKKILIILTGIILLVSIPVVIFFTGQQQELRSKAAPATTLSIQPASPTAAVGDTIVWKILINTAENKVTSVKVSLLFDQTKFESLSITNGALAPKIISQGTVGVGTATITVAAESTAKPISGQGEIAVLRLKAIGGSTTPVAVQFAPDTVAYDIGERSVNVITSTQPGSITITGGDQGGTIPTVTPMTTPISTPSASSPTPTPTTKPLENLVNEPATPSALTFTVDTEATRGGKPLVHGTSPKGATITIVIHATPPQTQVVTANAEGKWEAVPTTNLRSGTYTIVVTALHPTTGATETVSSSFTIAGGIGGGEEAVGDAIPETGSTETTIFLLCIGIGMVLFGSVPFIKKI